MAGIKLNDQKSLMSSKIKTKASFIRCAQKVYGWKAHLRVILAWFLKQNGHHVISFWSHGGHQIQKALSLVQRVQNVKTNCVKLWPVNQFQMLNLTPVGDNHHSSGIVLPVVVCLSCHHSWKPLNPGHQPS